MEPADLSAYVKLPENDIMAERNQNLVRLLNQGTANIEIEECSFEAIHQVETEIASNRYVVGFVPIPEKGAFARFFLKKL